MSFATRVCSLSVRVREPMDRSEFDLHEDGPRMLKTGEVWMYYAQLNPKQKRIIERDVETLFTPALLQSESAEPKDSWGRQFTVRSRIEKSNAQ